ncbi:signal peptidase II [Bdellovibrio sp. KM01]|uniref:signal peptidase II n=1 Tax=Bdellovibrio sp. KM01 TaxID=2748865 RepID=UPI0015EAB7F0|nr:signal peptidase II [Bdellovibrio sp. KM01]QLY26030.1 signal peptidase II [Bdellovibrio sp. KM01]
MKKREWLIVILPLVATWLVDRVTKLWATDITSVKSHGPLHFVLHHNHGAMLGLFSDLPSVLRIVSLSTGGAFLLCTYALIQYMLPIKSLTLRCGLSILIGGILGNVADRIVWGYVVDFIVVGTPTLSSPAFNIADALQWVGYALIVFAIIREGELLWPENNSRKKFWVNLSFQLKYCILMMAVGLSLTLISLVFSYTYLRVTIQELVGNNQFLLNKFLVPYVITFIIICVAFCAITFAVGKVLSHRIAGPIYAFERYLYGIMRGENIPLLKVRKGDEFKELEALAEEITKRLNVIKAERTVNVVEFNDGINPDDKPRQ